MLTFNEYQQLAQRTAGAGFEDGRLRLAVAGLGLAEEVAELYEHLRGGQFNTDEAGDCLWYIQEVAFCAGIEGLTFDIIDFPFVSQGVVTLAGTVAGRIKRHVGHGRELQGNVIGECLQKLIVILADYALEFDTTIFEVAQGNIDKLKSRWPEGFKMGVK